MAVEEQEDDTVLERIWIDIQQRKGGGSNNDDTFRSLTSHLRCGYTTDEASAVRDSVHHDAFNVVPPPIDCPGWLCIILPCINHIKSMKSYKSCIPEDAEVLRNGKWIRYDASSLVVGDVVRVQEGDTIPADCVIAIDNDVNDDLLVDMRIVTGQIRPKQLNSNEAGTRNNRTLLYGGTVVQGYATAMITAIGTETVLGKLIKQGKFPVSEKDVSDDMDGVNNMVAMEMGSIS